MRSHKPGDIARARYLRKNMTEAELRMWRFLKLGFPDLRFRRQCPVGPYVLDFYSPMNRLCIELDGPFHEDRATKDKQRDSYLIDEHFILTVRFSTTALVEDPDGVCQEIRRTLEWWKPLVVRKRAK